MLDERHPRSLHSALARRGGALLVALLLPLLPTGRLQARPAGFVASIDVRVPGGHDPFEAYERVRSDEGMPLDEQLVRRHVDSLGELGWVASVDVHIEPEHDDRYDLTYVLTPNPPIRSIRFLGNLRLDEPRLRGMVSSREGQCFDLRLALDDAQRITLGYEEQGMLFSGILEAGNVQFQDGVLTFRIVEGHLDPRSGERLRAGGVRPTEGPLTREGLSDLLAEGEMRQALRLEGLRMRVDRHSGAVRLENPGS